MEIIRHLFVGRPTILSVSCRKSMLNSCPLFSSFFVFFREKKKKTYFNRKVLFRAIWTDMSHNCWCRRKGHVDHSRFSFLFLFLFVCLFVCLFFFFPRKKPISIQNFVWNRNNTTTVALSDGGCRLSWIVFPVAVVSISKSTS